MTVPQIGIDLGTTFCCVAYVNEDGKAIVIPNAEGEQTTPSVVRLDARSAVVGSKAVALKDPATEDHGIFEWVKRSMGKPVEPPPGSYFGQQLDERDCAPYQFGGFKYGAAGMSAIILHKLKRDSIKFFKRKELIPENVNEKDVELEAIITVPAYFGDKERQETRLAGYAAGLNVTGIINEPTAAALTYGLLKDSAKLMVFDLGGGTFDVTLLQVKNGDAEVVTSDGHNTLGGRDWDQLIVDFIFSEFKHKTGRELPAERSWQFLVQKEALKAKFDLSDDTEAAVMILDEETSEDVVIKLYREAPTDMETEFDLDSDPVFYFEQRSTNLLTLCREVCKRVLDRSGWSWRSIDEILLAGGSCRMPMIPKMIEEMSGRKVRRSVEGFSYDTAIALGAALYGCHRSRVRDVVNHSVGVKLKDTTAQQFFIDHLLKKDTQLEAYGERIYNATPNATLTLYEGESDRPDECIPRGRIELGNPAGQVKVKLTANQDGILRAVAEFEPDGEKVLEVKNEAFTAGERHKLLRERVQAIRISDMR